MASFKIEEQVEALDFDFHPYVGKKGTIPEPTSDQMSAFIGSMQQFFTEKDGKMVLSAQVLAKVEEGSDVEGEMLGAMEALCSGVITASDLRRLPFRLQRAFMGWIMGSLFSDPQSSTPVTNG